MPFPGFIEAVPGGVRGKTPHDRKVLADQESSCLTVNMQAPGLTSAARREGAAAKAPRTANQEARPEPRFDELVHAPTRLSIMALLAAAEWADFKFIRDNLDLSDSALSKQLSALEEAGYVEIRKGFVGKRPRTSVRLSDHGRRAFDGHVAALQQLLRLGASGVGTV